MNALKYKYGDDFQQKILALMVQDPQFLACYGETVNPSYFEKPYFSSVCQILQQYFATYRQVPDCSSAFAMANDYCTRFRIQPEVANPLYHTLNYIYSTPISDLEFVRTATANFGRRQALRDATGKIIDRLEKDDQSEYDSCRQLIERALEVGSPRHSILDVGTNFANIPSMAQKSKTYGRRVPTGLPFLDGCMQGGLGEGEIGVLVAPAGVGKSTCLVNFGYGALFAGYNVLHITLELKDIDIALKYAARTTGCTMEQVIRNDPQFQHAVQSGCAIPSNRLQVRYFSPGTCTTDNVRSLVSFLRVNGFNVNLVVIDYLKRMKYDGEVVGGLGRICDQLVAAGDEYGFGVWTAQQAQRMTRGSARTSVNNIANDVTILENADVAIAISQTEEEHKTDRLRFEIQKVRRGDDSTVLFSWIQYSKATVYEMNEGEIRQHYNLDNNSQPV